MDLGLAGAKVLVTAASQGLGAATARRFSLEGAQVVISSRDREALQATAARINAESSNLVYTITNDVTDFDAARRMVDNAVEMLGGLDVIVVNAGGPPAGAFADFDLDAWQRATQLVLMSALNLTQAAIPHLQKSRRAAILAIVSTSAKQPVPNLTLSNVIRPAVVAMIKSIATEYGAQGIRANCILPGTTETGRVDQLMQARAQRNSSTPDEERARTAAEIPLRRIGTPEEFANAAVFLCSPAGGYITGVALPVDGGSIRSPF